MSNKHLSEIIIIVCTLLLSSSFLSSCVLNDRTLGEDFVTEDYIIKIAKEEFPLNICTAYPDSVQGYSNSQMVFGYIKDDLFGLAESSAVSHVIPAADSLIIGEDPRLRDAYIYLTIDSTHSNIPGQEGILQNIQIYRLKKDLDSSTIHNTSFTLDDVYETPISKGAPIYTGGDSVKIYITDSFAEDLLKTTYEESNDLKLFKERIKGIYITCGEIPAGIPDGGRMNYLSLGNSRIYVNYNYADQNEPDGRKEGLQIFYFGAQKATNLYKTSSSYLASDELSDKIYIEGMSGVKPVIRAEYLKGMFGKWMEEHGFKKGGVIVSRASIVLPYEMPKEYYQLDLAYPGSIYPCTLQKLYQETQSTDYYSLPEEVFTVYHTGAINRTNQRYKLDITSYIQNLLLDDDLFDAEMAKDLWFFPLLTQYDKKASRYVYQVNVNSCTRAVLNGTNSERAPRLELVYSVINLKD